MGTGSPFGVMKMFLSQVEVVVAQYFEYTECQWPVHLKRAHFRSREFYLNFKKRLAFGQADLPVSQEEENHKHLQFCRSL